MSTKTKRISRKLFPVSLIKTYVSWLLGIVKCSDLALKDFTPYLDLLARVFETRGKLAGITFSKAIRANVMNYLSGNPERVEGVRITTSDGLPVGLGPLLRVVRDQDPVKLRLVMTVLFCTRFLKTVPSPSLDPIVAPLNKGTNFGRIPMFAAKF